MLEIRFKSEMLSLVTSSQISVYRLTVHYSGAPIRPQLQAAVMLTWNKKKHYLSQYLNNLMHKNLFHNKFYFMPLHIRRKKTNKMQQLDVYY